MTGRCTIGFIDRLVLVVGLVAVGLGAIAESAAAMANPLEVRGRLEIWIGSQSVFLSQELRGSVQVDAQVRSIEIPAGLVATSGLLSGTDPVAFFSVSNAAATLRPGGAATGTCPGPLSGAGACIVGRSVGGGFGGAIPLVGTLTIGSGESAIVLSADVVGGGGIASATGIVVQGVPFTARTAAVTTTGASGFWTTAMGSAPASWLDYGGEPASEPIHALNLVTPVHIAIGDETHLPVIVSLELIVAPEPGAVELLIGVLTGLAALHRRAPKGD